MSVNILERSLIKLELMLELIWSVGQLGESLFYDWRHSALLVLILQVTISTITDNKHHGQRYFKHQTPERKKKNFISFSLYKKCPMHFSYHFPAGGGAGACVTEVKENSFISTVTPTSHSRQN